MNWETFKEQAKTWYARTSQVLVFLSLCFYLIGCVVAERPISPKAFVSFGYHCFQWEPGKVWLGREGVYLSEKRR